MSLSSIAVEQREREAKKLNSLLAFGLIGSLALHIGVLSINIGNLTKKVTEVKEEPLEIEIVELPDTPKPEEKTPPAKISSTNNSNSEAIALSSNNDVTPATPKAASAIAPSQPVIKAEKPPIAVAPTQEIERVKTQPILPQKVAPPPKATVSRQPPPVAKANVSSEIATQPKPIRSSPPLESASPKPAPPIQQANRPESSPISPAPSDRQLRNLLASTRNAQPNPSNSVPVSKPSAVSDRQTSNIANNLRNQTGSNNAVASTTREPSNNSGQTTTSSPSSNSNNSGQTTTSRRSQVATGSGSTNSTTTTSRRSGSTVATGAQNSRATSQPNTNTGSRASDGIGCVRCSKPKYPEKARRRGLEGNAEISVDTDSRGNVTNVRLARSSGHSELDKAALAEAKRWKLKPTNGGKQGVVAKVDFAIEGSERSRKRQQRKKRQQTEQRRTTPTTETATAPTSTRRKRNITSTQNATAPTSTRRKRNITSTQNATAPRRTQIRRVDSLPPRRTGDVPQRQRPTATSQANSRTRLRQSLRRQRPTENRATPKTQTQLRQSLRQLRQTSQPAANPANE